MQADICVQDGASPGKAGSVVRSQSPSHLAAPIEARAIIQQNEDSVKHRSRPFVTHRLFEYNTQRQRDNLQGLFWATQQAGPTGMLTEEEP